MITFSLIATLEINNIHDSWVLDYNLTKEDCEIALIDFGHASIFANGVLLTCEIEEQPK
mgnify:CR=1 FL=1